MDDGQTGWGEEVVRKLRRARVERPEWIVLAAAAVLLLSMMDKAVTIDDPLFIWTAKQIQAKPLDPYGFEMNWFGASASMTMNVQNPPLTSYWLSLAGFVSWGERWLHLAMLPWALLALWGTMRLARQLGADPFLAGLLTLGTSAFLVSATNLMCDVMMLALMVWAVSLWIDGLERRHALILLASGLVAGAAILTKYFALGIVPMLLVYTIIRRRGVAWELLALLVPAAVAAGWHFWTIHLYGASHITGAIDYTKSLTSGFDNSLARLYAAIIGLGGCLIWPLFLVWRIRPAGTALAVLGAAGGSIGLWWLTKLDSNLAPSSVSYVLAALFGGAGLVVLHMWIHDVAHRWKNPEAWLLAMWIGGTALFFSLLNWTVSARNILPLVPPVAIIAALSFNRPKPDAELATEDHPAFAPKPLPLLPIAAAVGIVLAVAAAWSDYAWAGGVRDRAVDLACNYARNGKVAVFTGHWGFQYYMEAEGALAYDLAVDDSRVDKRGLYLILPLNNTDPKLTRFAKWPVERVFRDRYGFGIYLMNGRHGAGFYSSIIGPLPLAWSNVPPDVYLVRTPPEPPK